MKSACDLLMKKTYREVWLRGKKYAEEGRVEVISMNDKAIEATVKGTESYNVSLKFPGSGISNKCTCPYGSGACKHMVATAILWDENRGIKSPDAKKIEAYTVPPPEVSRAEINKMFAKPLEADLEVLRTLSEKSGGWSRPHARLPQMPFFNIDEKLPLDMGEVKHAFSEMAKWARKSNYDPYFCAGEMVAAYCTVISLIKKRVAVSEPLIAAEILLEAQKFNCKLMTQLIDSSDGVHVFTEAYLDDLYEVLKKVETPTEVSATISPILAEYEAHRNDY